MIIRTVAVSAFIAAGLLVTTDVPVFAQDCGENCGACFSGYEGTSYGPLGGYNMTCFSFVPYCVACPKVEQVSDHTADVQRIVALLETTPAADLAAVAHLYKERLLVSPERGMVVIRGTACDPDVLAAVVFVEEAKARQVQLMGAGLLADHFVENSK